MKTQTDKTYKQQKETIQRVQKEPSIGGKATITDNRPGTIVQRKLRSGIESFENNTSPIQRKNNSGLPNQLKSGIENLSGYNMDDVKVYYNSSKPAQLQAHAYAQGTDIHLASGQEKHLPHEAWHVVQQKQGRVKPTMQFKGKVNINDDGRLEKEADVMGEKALQLNNREKRAQRRSIQHQMNTTASSIQLKALDKDIDPNKLNIVGENHNVSDKRTRIKEQRYVNDKFDTYMKYWTENELHHDIGSLDNEDHSFYGDSRVLLFLDKLCFLLVIIGGYRKAKKAKDRLDLFHGIKSEMASLEHKKKEVLHYEAPETIENEELLGVHEFLKAKDNEKLFTEIQDIHQGPLFDEKLNEATNIIENLVNEYFAPNMDRKNPLTAAYLYENRKKYQKESNSYSTRRGHHMQRFAHKFGQEHRGIWKVGNAHIQQISDHEDSLEDFKRINYTLINRKTFDYPFTRRGTITNGIYNFGKRIMKGKEKD